MPNHVTNILTAFGDQAEVKEMFNAIRPDSPKMGTIDFNKVIPMPEYIFKGNLGQAEREKYGEDNWYDWSIKNWGTKWNAYDCWEQYATENSITFNTAWDSVDKIIKKLSEMYPKITFEYKWADEDFGYNTGVIEYLEGEVLSLDIPKGGSKEAFELVAEIFGINLEEDYRYNERKGTYEHIRDVEDNTDGPTINL